MTSQIITCSCGWSGGEALLIEIYDKRMSCSKDSSGGYVTKVIRVCPKCRGVIYSTVVKR